MQRQVLSDTIASGASTSGGISLGPTPWSSINVVVGTMSTAAAISVQNSVDGGNTFYNVFNQSINSATVATPQFFIASGVGTGGGVTPIINGLTYVRFLTTGVVSGGVSFKIICNE